MANQLEIGVVHPVHDVLLPAGEEVIENDDLVACHHEAVHEVRADEAGSSGDEDAHALGFGELRHLETVVARLFRVCVLGHVRQESVLSR